MADVLGGITKLANGTADALRPILGELGSVGGQLANLLDFGSAGSTTPFVKSPGLASVVYGLENTALYYQIPFLGFEYYVHIYPDGNLKQYFESFFGSGLTNYNDIMPLIKSVTLPSVDVDTKILNEYNRPRVSQTKLNYKPVKLVIHDAVDGKVLKLWKAYYQYYFSDGIKNDADRMQQLNPDLFPNGKFGYNLSQVGDLKYLFNKIEIFQIHAKRVIKTTIWNPRIRNFTHDTLSYDASDAVEINLDFDYEWIEYETCGSYTSQSDNYLKDFLEKSKPYEIRYSGQPLSTRPCPVDPFETGSEKLAGMLPGGDGGIIDDITGGIRTAVGMAQTTMQTVRDIKRTAQVVVGKVASAAHVWNQVQMDVLGVDEPIIPAPNVRDMSAVVNQIPTSYSGIRQFSRTIRYGELAPGDND